MFVFYGTDVIHRSIKVSVKVITLMMKTSEASVLLQDL